MGHRRIGAQRLIGPALLLAAAGCAHLPPAGPAAKTSDSKPAAAGQSPAGPRPTPASSAQPGTHRLAAHVRADAPKRYVVKHGDTLWDIARRYLDNPAYWPRLWHANPGVGNPDLIYPGDVLILTRGMNGRPQLTHEHERTVHLSPRIRKEPASEAIAVIPYDAIRDFLTGPKLVDDPTLKNAPYIVALAQRHLIGGNGATAYVRGAQAGGPKHYELVHPDGLYRDHHSHEVLGRKVLPVGQITLEHGGDDIATGTIAKTDREARPGDRLLAVSDEDVLHDFYPHAPAHPVSAHIISVYGGVTQIGQYDVVTLDRGGKQGVQRGDVLNVETARRRVADPVTHADIILPHRKAGRLMVFKVADKVSFGLIMRATRAIHVNDVVRAPGTVKTT